MSESDAELPFTDPHEELHLSFDPRVGFALLGSYAPQPDQARLRAYDVYRKRVAWDALTGEAGIDLLGYERLAVHGGQVYAGADRFLLGMDLLTGQLRWSAPLSGKLAYDIDLPERGARVYDLAPPGGSGPIWVVEDDDTFSALDRDTGQALWRETREAAPYRILPYGSGLLLERGPVVELVDPTTRTVADRVGPRVARLDLDGRYGLMQVEGWGPHEREGVLVHDFLARQDVLFEAVNGLDREVPCVSGQNRLFCGVAHGTKLFAAPGGRPVEIMPGFRLRTLAMCGPTLLVLASKKHGAGERRLLGVDPQSLAVRFDLGEWGSTPDDDWTLQICCNPYVAVAVRSLPETEEEDEVVAIDPGGRVLWSLPVGSWRGHCFMGGYVVVLSSRGWNIVRPDNGQVVAQFGAEDGSG